MVSEQIGLRVPESLLARIRERGEPAPTVRADLERYYALLDRARKRLATELTREELGVLFYALKGSMPQPYLVVASLEDAIIIGRSGVVMAGAEEAAMSSLLAKLRAMDDARLWALVDAVERRDGAGSLEPSEVFG
jgi:hypothetical protein